MLFHYSIYRRDERKVKREGEEKMKGMKKRIVVVVLAAALLVSMVGIASAASQLWYLDSDNHSAFDPATAPKVMEKTIGTQSGSVTISANGGEQIWLAEQYALVDVGIPAYGFWVITIVTDDDWRASCDVYVGGYNLTTGWYDISTTELTKFWDGMDSILTVKLHAFPATINKTDYLALKIKNYDTVAHTVDTDGSSSLISPETDPGYPISELSTIVLTSIGLLALVGYVGWRRKDNKKK